MLLLFFCEMFYAGRLLVPVICEMVNVGIATPGHMGNGSCDGIVSQAQCGRCRCQSPGK